MEVVLKQDVDSLGLRGEVVNVARGYARNFLLPRGLAETATAGLKKELERRDTQLLAGTSDRRETVELARRLAVLRSFQGQPDPTLRRASTAIAPSSASWPNVWAWIGVPCADGNGRIGGKAAPVFVRGRRRADRRS